MTTKLNIYDAKYERTFKVADYESEKFALSAAVAEGEDVKEIFDGMKTIVRESFSGKGTPGRETTAVASMPKASATNSPAKTPVKETPAKEVKAEPEVKTETKAAETKTEAPVKETKAKAVKAPAITKYTRDLDDHRGKMGAMLDKICPKWRDNPKAKEVGKTASIEMEGADFIDEKGNFVESFLAEVKNRMAPFCPDDL